MLPELLRDKSARSDFYITTNLAESRGTKVWTVRLCDTHVSNIEPDFDHAVRRNRMRDARILD